MARAPLGRCIACREKAVAKFVIGESEWPICGDCKERITKWLNELENKTQINWEDKCV